MHTIPHDASISETKWKIPDPKPMATLPKAKNWWHQFRRDLSQLFARGY